MMRVTVEIHPNGDSSRARTIATIDIANVSELAPMSDYVATCRTEDATEKVFVFGHCRSDGWMALVRRVVEGLQASAVKARSRQRARDPAR